jgi:hypothetical protein
VGAMFFSGYALTHFVVNRTGPLRYFCGNPARPARNYTFLFLASLAGCRIYRCLLARGLPFQLCPLRTCRHRGERTRQIPTCSSCGSAVKTVRVTFRPPVCFGSFTRLQGFFSSQLRLVAHPSVSPKTILSSLRWGFDRSQNVCRHFVQLDVVMLGHQFDAVIRYRLHCYILHRYRSA